MDLEEALQMDLLGHDYLCRCVEDQTTNVLYRREDGSRFVIKNQVREVVYTSVKPILLYYIIIKGINGGAVMKDVVIVSVRTPQILLEEV